MLLEMRKFRMGLIQTADQLRFSYLAVIEGARFIMGDSSAQVSSASARSKCRHLQFCLFVFPVRFAVPGSNPSPLPLSHSPQPGPGLRGPSAVSSPILSGGRGKSSPWYLK